MKIVDLSRELYHRAPTYPGHPPIIHGIWKSHEDAFAESGQVYGLSSMFISMPDHAGTHIDAPRHFGKNGIPISEYPLEKCIVPGICLDLRHIAPRAEITPGDLEVAVKQTGLAVPKGGTVLLAVTGANRWFDLPDVPTMVELGYKDFISDTFQGFLAPAKTPPAIVEQLATKSIEILKMPEIAEQLRNDGFEVLANGPDGMQKRIVNEVPKWRDIIVKAGIKPV